VLDDEVDEVDIRLYRSSFAKLLANEINALHEVATRLRHVVRQALNNKLAKIVHLKVFLDLLWLPVPLELASLDSTGTPDVESLLDEYFFGRQIFAHTVNECGYSI